MTVVAWRKEWGAWALLPMAMVVGLAIFIGMAGGAAGASEGGLFAIGVILDLSGVGALIAMTVREPRTDKQRQVGLPAGTATVAGRN